MKKFFLLLCIFALTASLSLDIKAQDMSIGLALKGSTMGVGGDLVFRFNQKMDARIGYDMLTYGPRMFSFKEQGINYDAEARVKTGSVTALYDYYLSNIVFVAVGVGLNNFKVDITGQAAEDVEWGDVTIEKAKVGDFAFSLTPGLKLSPYLGIGFGNTLSKDKMLGFAFEIGSYYMGGPNVDIEATGLLTPTAMEEHGQEALFESQLSSFGFYPVLKFSLNFKLASF